MDSILHKLEKYADNLEDIVQQRTAELIEEKQKTDMLLNRMLPQYAFVMLFITRSHGIPTLPREQGPHFLENRHPRAVKNVGGFSTWVLIRSPP